MNRVSRRQGCQIRTHGSPAVRCERTGYPGKVVTAAGESVLDPHPPARLSGGKVPVHTHSPAAGEDQGPAVGLRQRGHGPSLSSHYVLMTKLPDLSTLRMNIGALRLLPDVGLMVMAPVAIQPL